MDGEAINRKIQEFHKRHGGECYSDGFSYYYPNGAYRDVEPLGVLAEPPDDSTEAGEHQLATLILKFHKAKLQAAVAEFDEINTRLAFTIPADPDTEIAKLAQLQKLIEERREGLRKAEEALENTRWGRSRQAMLQARQEQLQNYQNFHERRRAIRI